MNRRKRDEPEEEYSAEVEVVTEDELAETEINGEDELDEDTDSDEQFRRARGESTGEFEAKIDVAARALADGEIGAWSDADSVSQSDEEDEDQDDSVEEADEFADEEADESADDEVAADEEESDDDEEHELSPEDEALIRAIEADDEPDGDDKPEADVVTEHVVPPQSEAEMTVNMEIDAELMAAAATEQQSDEKSVAEAFGADVASKMFDENSAEVETIIMDRRCSPGAGITGPDNARHTQLTGNLRIFQPDHGSCVSHAGKTNYTAMGHQGLAV